MSLPFLEGRLLFQLRIYSKTKRLSFFFKKSWILDEAAYLGLENAWAFSSPLNN